MSKIVGIDFGTTNSLVSVFEGGAPKTIISSKGTHHIPSVVIVGPEGQIYSGWDAWERPPLEQWSSQRFTVTSIKRQLGRTGETTWGAYTTFPQEIASFIFSQLKLLAEEYLGEEVTDAVIAVPAYFDINERTATYEAAQIAGFRVVRMLHEPTAAALYYYMGKKVNQQLAFFDLGGGTFDISIVECLEDTIEVLSASGDSQLGGDDLDEVLVNYFAEEFRKTEGMDLRNDPMSLWRLKQAAEKAKCELSTRVEADINLPFIASSSGVPKHVAMTVTRAKFEQLARTLFGRLRTPCQQVLKDGEAKLRKRGESLNISEVVLVGGSTRIPKVQEIAKEMFGCALSKRLDPEQAVALGAAVQAEILAGSAVEMVLLDLLPKSVGVETVRGVTSTVIERGATIPTSRTEPFSTVKDNQTEVNVRVVQGDHELAKDNTTLGTLNLSGILPAPKGVPRIEVHFDVGFDGRLEVSAKDSATNRTVQASLHKGPYHLSPVQMKVLGRKVNAYFESVRKRKAYEREKELNEIARTKAQRMAKKITGLLSVLAKYVDRNKAHLLESGAKVIQDYLDRNASREQLAALVSSIHKAHEELIVVSLQKVAESIVVSPKFVQWSSDAVCAQQDPVHLDTLLRDFENHFEEQLCYVRDVLKEYAYSEKGLLIKLFSDNKGWDRKKICLAILSNCCLDFDIDISGAGNVQTQDRDFASAALLLLVRQSKLPTSKELAAKELYNMYRGNECFLLLKYVVKEPSTPVNCWLQKCLMSMAEGTWLQRFLTADAVGRAELRASPFAVRAICLDTASILPKMDSALQLKALSVLEEFRSDESLLRLHPLLSEQLTEQVQVRLIALVGSLPDCTAVLPLMQSLKDKRSTVRDAAVSALAEHKILMTPHVQKVFNIVEKVMTRGRRLSFWNRRFLARAAKKQTELEGLITVLRGQNCPSN